MSNALNQPAALNQAYLDDCVANGCSGKYIRDTIQFTTFLDLLHENDRPAIVAAGDGRKPLSHRELRAFLGDGVRKQIEAALDLRPSGGLLIGTAVPNGTEAGVAVLTSMTYGETMSKYIYNHALV